MERLHTIFDSGFPYSRRLEGHKSCVNALDFSSGNGRWLASAGDDLLVLLWDFYQEDVKVPSHSFHGHRANVFCLDFSSHNQYIYSGSTDELILKYDISRAGDPSLVHQGPPLAVFTSHDDSVRAVSCHPQNDEIFLSASEDGTVLLHDTRAQESSTRACGKISNSSEFTDVQYHPQLESLFVTADNRGHVRLRDSRMAFASGAREDAGTVLQYESSISRKSVPRIVRPETSSVRFDRQGKMLAVTFLHYFPTIYDFSDPFPLAVCSGARAPGGLPIPDGERTFVNSCTIKHGSFGGPGLDEDIYYSMGSDDFRTYVWKIPELSELRAKRREVSWEDWTTTESPRTVGFTTKMTAERHVPVELDTPIFRLNGHRSIVNTTLIHPHFPQIVTAGIERHITLHSPSAFAPNVTAFELTDPNVRRLPEANREQTRRYLEAALREPQNFDVESPSHSEVNAIDAEEESTVALFDGILLSTGAPNVFTTATQTEDDVDSDVDATAT
ncbi:WD40 repeat-like protein [Rickenella mellea]|uniref:WD40 repeat-like protein n=1 Tax=Rickenella mellea TaxID=50990 RepID=A0A4Y7Q4H2_9AGAM|nr:WD40 repeat-like protein [Rickenella mellea]